MMLTKFDNWNSQWRHNCNVCHVFTSLDDASPLTDTLADTWTYFCFWNLKFQSPKCFTTKILGESEWKLLGCEGPNLNHVLRPLRVGQEGPPGPHLAGRPLGQKVDEGSRLRDQHREKCWRNFAAESQDGSSNVRPSPSGSRSNLFPESQVPAGRL